jgi:hypothetical protein
MYAQYFIYDPDKATRLRSAHNTNLSQLFLRELDVMIRQFNSYYRIFQTAREMLSEISNSQLTRIVITPRLQLIMEKGADRRRENLPVADEIALLISGEEDKPDSREVILTARPARDTPNQVEPLHRISYTHPLYHTLHYVFLYPFGEPGRDFLMNLLDPRGRRTRTRGSGMVENIVYSEVLLR